MTARDLATQSLGWHIHSVALLPKVPNQSSHDRDERQRIHELLRLELDASASLNQRATTLFALLTATSAAVIAFAGAFWLKRNEAGAFPVDAGTIVVAIVLAVLTIVFLALGASLGLWAIVPRSAWRQEVRALLTLHVVGAPARWHSGVLVDAADKQRVQNEHKAWLLRWQAGLAAAGVILAFAHVLIVLVDVAL